MASAMTATTPSTGMVVSISGSGLLDRDALDDVGNLLERVGGVLEAVDDGLDLDQVDRVGRVVEEGRHHLAVQRVGLVLEPVDLDPVALEVLETVGHGLALRRLDLEEPGQLVGRLDEELGRGGEESEKAGVLGCEAKTHG